MLNATMDEIYAELRLEELRRREAPGPVARARAGAGWRRRVAHALIGVGRRLDAGAAAGVVETAPRLNGNHA